MSRIDPRLLEAMTEYAAVVAEIERRKEMQRNWWRRWLPGAQIHGDLILRYEIAKYNLKIYRLALYPH